MASAFSSSDSEVISRKTDTEPHDPMPIDHLDEFYEISLCIDWINDNKLMNVGLQFPDSMHADSSQVSLNITSRSNANTFILGDTSYGSCCVDEVTAARLNIDAIIHYGHACLSPTRGLPILYVFGKQSIHVEHFMNEWKLLTQNLKSNLILLYDVIYYHAIDTISSKLAEHHPNLIVSTLDYKRNGAHSSDHDSQEHSSSHQSAIKKFGRCFKLIDGTKLEDYSIFYIGSNQACLRNFMMAFNKCPFYTYNPETKLGRRETLDVNKNLMKRYYLVEKAKDARIIGILVGTLGVADYRIIIERLEMMIKDSGRRSYTLVMGKINVEKLANFPEIDVFTLVACPENSLIDSKEFYRPIITPYELEIACNKDRLWTGDYITDFRDLLPGAYAHVEFSADESEAATVSLITGAIRNSSSKSGASNIDDDCMAIIKRDDALIVSTLHKQGAGEFLADRSWRGLEPKLEESTPVGLATTGRHGVAAGYTTEPKLD